ncbi:GbsR/MarR family transcriptional regulator [Streptomyces galbus]|uniref:Transcriptional regulator n=1 Tax=Streptomyces galbus TaxID=33898 RepID=A0ABX1IRH3_STRGB|nr:transcriptional regulator [Streptomyces galbus]NKQ28198.1 transcriptional regulator [Streptomyces galbus]
MSSTDDAGTARDPDEERIAAWMERVTAWLMQQAGWPPIMGRTMAWLMVSEPPEQTAAQMAEAVRASRASLTTTLRLLTEARMVQVVTRAGERATYYRMADDAWSGVLKRRLESLTSFVDITAEGLRLLPQDEVRATRMREAHRMFTWLDSEAGPLWQRWEAVNAGDGADGPKDSQHVRDSKGSKDSKDSNKGDGDPL